MTDTSNPTSTAVEKRDQSPSGLIEQYRGDFALVLPSHIKPDVWVRVTQGICRRDKQLAQVARKNPGSFLSALLDAARLGLEPGDTYHLVAFGNEVTGIPDYKGIIELIYRAGAVSSVVAEVVHAADDYRPGVGGKPPTHDYDPFGERGEMIGAYAYAVMKDGATSKVIEMGKAEIMKHKAVSKMASKPSSPWNKWEKSQWLKVVAKQLSKWVPTSPEYRSQIAESTAAVESTRIATEVGYVPVPDYDPDDVDDDIHDAEDRRPVRDGDRRRVGCRRGDGR